MKWHKVVPVLFLSLLLIGIFGVSSAIAQDDEIVFGVIMVGPKTDGGWSQAHFEGGQYVEQNLPGARMIDFESLNSADSPEVSLEDVIAEMVDEGAEVIFTTSDAFEEDTLRAAPNFPDTVLINISGDDVALGGTPPNMGNFTGKLHIPREIAGCAAALATNTGKIGMVGPLINDETRRDQAAAYLGARYCWENENYLGRNADELEFEVIWIGFWFNLPGITLDPAEVTSELFNTGSDVIINGIDTLEPLDVTRIRAEEGDEVYFVGTDSRTVCERAVPAEICLGTQYYNWGPAFLETVQAVADGTWEPSWAWNGPDWDDINNLDTTAVGFVMGEGLDDDQRALLEQFIADITAMNAANPESAPLWTCPLFYQDGTQICAEGETLPEFQLQEDGPSVWYTTQLLQGMIGASE